MKLEDQVVSLELAKKLKELGFKQDCYVKWCIWDKNDMYYADEKDRLFTQEQWEDFTDEYSPSESEFFAAYTVAELVLPEGIFSGIDFETKKPRCEQFQWHSNDKKAVSTFKKFDAETEADARAKMLIYLKENKLI